MLRKPSSQKKSVPASPRLLIQSSAIHAAGCYTLDPVPRGTRLLKYEGERLTKHAADVRYAERFVTYLFGFGDGSEVIDGFGTPMFLNHSCDPNCETDEQKNNIYIRALRDIKAGEELVYDYHLYDSDLSDTADCYCGTKSCRGTMYSEDEVKRRDRLLKQQKSRKAKHRAEARVSRRASTSA